MAFCSANILVLQFYILSWLSLVGSKQNGYAIAFRNEEIVPSYFARCSHCIVQLLFLLTGCWVPTVGQLPPPTRTSKANNNTNQKEKVAFKSIHLNNKKARYDSHYEFIASCEKEKIIPDRLKVYLKPSIGKYSEQFLNNWHERLQSFSFTLMPDLLTFCEKTIETVSLEIKETKKELINKLEHEKMKE